MFAVVRPSSASATACFSLARAQEVARSKRSSSRVQVRVPSAPVPSQPLHLKKLNTRLILSARSPSSPSSSFWHHDYRTLAQRTLSLRSRSLTTQHLHQSSLHQKLQLHPMLPSDRISSSRSPPPLSRPRLGRSLSQSQPSGSLSLFDGVMGGMEARGSGLQRINNTSQGPSAPSLQWNSNPLDSYGPTLSQSPPRLNYYNDPSANMHHLPSLSPGPPMMSSLGRRPSFTTGLGAAKPYSRPAPQQPALGIDPSLLFSGVSLSP